MNTQQALQGTFDYFLDPDREPGYRNGNCVYYANGSAPVMCAIGCLIPVEYQKEAGEIFGGVEALFDNVQGLREFFKEVDPWTLTEMQNVHDSWAGPGDGVGFGLSTTSKEIFLDHLQTLMCYAEAESL